MSKNYKNALKSIQVPPKNLTATILISKIDLYKKSLKYT